MTDKSRERITTCFHCGNRTVLVNISEHRQAVDEYTEDDDGVQHVIGVWHTEWSLWKCRSCDNVTVIKTEWDSFTLDYHGRPIESESILYPSVSITDSAIPEDVASAFEAALKVKQIEPTMCLIGLRRTLDRLCKEQGEYDGPLFVKLTNLANRGVLPAIVKDMAHVLREVGNEAAHGDDVDVSDAQLKTMVDLTKTILDYVYVLPTKLSEINSRRGTV